MAERAEDIAPLLAEAMKKAVAGVTGIEGLARLSGGASQETYRFDAVKEDGTLPLILRRAPGGIGVQGSGTAAGLETEAALIRLAEKYDVPVPPVVHVLGEEDAMGSGFVMGRIEGETIARKILRDDEFADARPKLARQCGEILAKLHRMDVAALPPLRKSGAAVELEHYNRVYREHNHPHPVFELALKWLSDNMPEEREPTFVHGDFRHGNLMIGPDGVRAVLDWELAHLGDPMEDLGWICVNSWRFGGIDKPVGGFGTYDEMFEGYESVTGVPVDRDRVHFWEVMGTAKWGIMCTGMITAYTSGIDKSVERVTIGRRSSETEIDLMRLLAPVA